MTEPETARLGARIRTYRNMRRMTVRGLAVEAKASPSFISQLERGRTSASIGMLRRIATALGLTVADLFSEEDEIGHRVVRRPSRPELRTAPGTRKYLISQRPLQNVEVYAGEFDPGASTGDEPYSHGESQEILLVLHGRITVWLGPSGSASPHVLGPGDSVEYRTSVPHRVANEGDQPAEVIWVISPPTPA
ncbi:MULTISPECIES: helix-turn-helix domain-containing protein [Nonomuraea]|uniref:Helix-turn-helix domain-containing protein n=2 Tax=Nonomuraea TaxID=83681 RepID=A0ABW1C1D8_9ACTN|nr:MULTISPECIES: cupin domain-containing protein [Nonomuraea]MDA0644081.1 cupin domain-containing protein [Nonomuraea ferruginea]TXK39842.1 cupin domain-containing protein [Nonomuraea sp. C10]